MKNDFNDNDGGRRISRREAIRWVALASASSAMLGGKPWSAGAAPLAAKPYGTDPLLTEVYEPGAFWPLTLDAPQRRTLAAVCDLMIPADDKSPGASQVGVPDFVDEWISAPYPAQQANRIVVLDGLQWIESESQRRFARGFHDLSAAQQSQIADDICSEEKAKTEFRAAAKSFTLLRSLIVGGFYTTPAGMKDLGYIGNVALAEFPEAPREVREKLGLPEGYTAAGV
jgi:hypothetical protein